MDSQSKKHSSNGAELVQVEAGSLLQSWLFFLTSFQNRRKYNVNLITSDSWAIRQSLHRRNDPKNTRAKKKSKRKESKNWRRQ